MTRPLARSLPLTRRFDRTGHGFVPSHLCLLVAFGRTPSSTRPVPFHPLALSVFRCFGRHRDRFIMPAVDEDRRLNAHAASAVTFNLLFPHS